jgi:hypothetical protein
MEHQRIGENEMIIDNRKLKIGPEHRGHNIFFAHIIMDDGDGYCVMCKSCADNRGFSRQEGMANGVLISIIEDEATIKEMIRNDMFRDFAIGYVSKPN